MPVKPNLGKLGAICLGLQTAKGTFIVPTLKPKATSSSDVQLDLVLAREDYKDGTLFDTGTSLAGITFQGKSFDALASSDLLKMLTESITAQTGTAFTAVTVTAGTGGAALNATSLPVTALSAALPAGTLLKFSTSNVTALVTAAANSGATTLTVAPLAGAIAAGQTASALAGTLYAPAAAENFDTLCPGKPLSLELQVPNAGVKAYDAQVTSLSVRSNGRENPFNASVNYSATFAEDLADGSFTNVAQSTVAAFTQSDAVFVYNGALVRPESVETTLAVGITPVDAINGGNFIEGFERTGEGLDLTGQVTLNTVEAALKADYNARTRVPLALELRRGTRIYRVYIPTAELRMFSVPNGMDRITPTAQFAAVSLTGAAPFTIFVN